MQGSSLGGIGGARFLDPASAESEHTLRPSNPAADALLRVLHCARDIDTLLSIRDEREREFERALLLKHAMVELVSMFELLDLLTSLVMRAATRTGPDIHGVTDAEREHAKVLLKSVHQERTRIEKDIRKIRNNIGAHRDSGVHRDSISWDEILDLWRKLNEPERLFAPVFHAAIRCVRYIFGLGLFEWHRTTPRGTIQIIQPGFRSGDIVIDKPHSC